MESEMSESRFAKERAGPLVLDSSTLGLGPEPDLKLTCLPTVGRWAVSTWQLTGQPYAPAEGAGGRGGDGGDGGDGAGWCWCWCWCWCCCSSYSSSSSSPVAPLAGHAVLSIPHITAHFCLTWPRLSLRVAESSSHRVTQRTSTHCPRHSITACQPASRPAAQQLDSRAVEQ